MTAVLGRVGADIDRARYRVSARRRRAEDLGHCVARCEALGRGFSGHARPDLARRAADLATELRLILAEEADLARSAETTLRALESAGGAAVETTAIAPDGSHRWGGTPRRWAAEVLERGRLRARYEQQADQARWWLATPDAWFADPDRRRTVDGLIASGDRRFLLIDPVGDGRAVEVFGDLAGARYIAVVVPGMGTDLEGFDAFTGRVRAIHDRATPLGGGEVATIAWLGYDPPDGFVADGSELAAAISDGRARAGGEELAALIGELPAARDRMVTLIGHSYGSTTAMAAVLEGADVDRVIVAGSPGVIVGGASDPALDGIDLFSMAAAGDPIARLGWFGGNPNDRGSGFRSMPVDGRGHSTYLDPDTANPDLLAELIVGADPWPGDR